MQRSPCLQCSQEGDRTICAEGCEPLRLFQVELDQDDAALQARIEAQRCRALVAAIFLGRSRSGRVNVHDMQARQLAAEARTRKKMREAKRAARAVPSHA